MGRRARATGAKPYLHGAMNVVSTLVLCLAIGRLICVLCPSQDDHDSNDQRVPKWMPTPGQDERRHTSLSGGRHDESGPRHALTTDDVLRGVKIPIHEQHQNLRQRRAVEGERAANKKPQPVAVESSYESPTSRRAGSPSGGSGAAWGLGRRVLIFTMDSLQDRVALASKGGPAGEIKIRESLSAALKEAGVEVSRCWLGVGGVCIALSFSVRHPELN